MPVYDASGTKISGKNARKLTPDEAAAQAGRPQAFRSSATPKTPLGGMSVEELQRLIDETPEVQAAIANVTDLQEALYDAGIPTEVPHDYSIDPATGRLTRDSFMERNPWVAGTVAAGGLLAGGAGLAALGSGGAGAGAGAGVAGTGAELGLTGALGTLPAATTTTAAGGGAMTGGSILSQLASNPETYSTIASQLGRMGEGQAGERGDENRYGADLNRALASIFGAEQGASTHATDAEERGKLDRAQLGLQAPDIRTRQSILGSLLQEMQPFSVGDTGRIKVPTISGGLTPAALNPAARETGSILQKQAIDALLSGSDIPEETDFQAARLPSPELNQYQGPGTGESILSGIGAAGNTFAGVMEALRRQSQGTGTQPSNGVGV